MQVCSSSRRGAQLIDMDAEGGTKGRKVKGRFVYSSGRRPPALFWNLGGKESSPPPARMEVVACVAAGDAPPGLPTYVIGQQEEMAEEPSAEEPSAEEPAAPAGTAEPPLTFARGDQVWAKWFGFPWWPARVCGIMREVDGKMVYPVRFYKTAERCMVGAHKKTLISYDSRADLGDSSKIKSKGLRSKFEAAVAEARDTPQVDEDNDPPDPPRPAEEEEGWLDEGSEHLGKRIARPFSGGLTTIGQIVRWLPAGDAADEPALFHVRHDDGDEEDLEEYEVHEAVALYQTTPEALKLVAAKAKATARAEREGERAAKAESRAAKARVRAEAATIPEVKVAAEEEARAALAEAKAARAAERLARSASSEEEKAALVAAKEEAKAAKAELERARAGMRATKEAAKAEKEAAKAEGKAAKVEREAARAAEKEAKAAEKARREAERAPKQPRSAYVFFCEAERPTVAASNRELDSAGVSKLLSQRWKEAETAAQQPHLEAAAADKARYAAECAAAGIDPQQAKRRKLEPKPASGAAEGGAPTVGGGVASGQGGAGEGGAALQVGCKRQVYGLKSAPELNGLEALVRAFDPSSGRYEVQVACEPVRIISIKPTNLLALDAVLPPASASPPLSADGQADPAAAAAAAAAACGADMARALPLGGSALPAGWTAHKHEAKSGSYMVYHGPAGERVRSMVQAWRIAGSTPTTGKAADPPSGEAGHGAERQPGGGGEGCGEGGGEAAAAGGAAAGVAEKPVRLAKTAYLFYVEATRKEVAAANPSLGHHAVNKLLGDRWKEVDAEGRKPFKDLAAADKQRYEDEKSLRAAAAEPPSADAAAVARAAREAIAAAASGASSSSSTSTLPLQPLPHAQATLPPKAAKPKTAKQQAAARLQSAKAAAAAKLAERRLAASHATPPVADVVRPDPSGLLPLRDASQAAEVLEVWLFVTAFSGRLGLTPFSARQLCAAVERGCESIVLVELGMALLRALCRQAPSLREKAQQLPPPMSADVQPELLLQQLPPPELVTPSTWGEVLRACGHLLAGFAANDDGEGKEQEAKRRAALALLGHTEFSHLPAQEQLVLLGALCDALLRTEEFNEDLKLQFEARAEAEAAVAREMRDKEREAMAAYAKDRLGASEAAAADGSAAIAMLALTAPLCRPGGGGGGEGGRGEGGGDEGGDGGAVELEGAELAEAKAAREAATEQLIAAIEAREEEGLEAAIETAEGAWHGGVLTDGRRWVSEELKAAKSLVMEEGGLRGRAKLSAELSLEAIEAKLAVASKHPMRETQLGKDRTGRTYWIFCHDPRRLWVEAPPEQLEAAAAAAAADRAMVRVGAASSAEPMEEEEAKGGAKDVAMEEAAAAEGDRVGASMAPGMRAKRLAAAAVAADVAMAEAKAAEGAAAEDEGTEETSDDGSSWSAPCEWRWAYYERVAHIERLVQTLDGRTGHSRAGDDEAALKRALGERLPYLVAKEAEEDEDEGRELDEEDKETWQLSGHPLLGRRVAVMHQFGSQRKEMVVGTLTKWLPAGTQALIETPPALGPT